MYAGQGYASARTGDWDALQRVAFGEDSTPAVESAAEVADAMGWSLEEAAAAMASGFSLRAR